jgi:hypothetical protein
MRAQHARGRKQFCLVLLIFLAGWCGHPFNASAVVDAASPANTNAPSDGSPWDSMGHVSAPDPYVGSGYGGIYLGAGWVLTAQHAAVGDTYFSETLFPWDGTSVRMTNSDGTGTDMQMFHLKTLPPLPRMPLSTTTPAANAQVDMIGFGFIAGSAQTTIGSYTGFYLSANQYKSWGNNRATGGTVIVTDVYGDVTSFETIFNAPPSQTSDEGQAEAGDSGGGVFEKNGSTWQLVGMMFGIDSQVNGAAVYNDVTYSANIATYRTQIAAVIAATRPVLSISRSGTNVMACWPDTGVTYNLESRQSLTNANWTALSPSLTLTNGQYCALLPATNGANFFHLRTP